MAVIDRTNFNAIVESNGTPGHGDALTKALIVSTILDPADTAYGSGGTPAGSTTQVQFNDAGAFGGDAGLTYNKTTDALTVGGPLAVTGAVTLSTTLAVTGLTTLPGLSSADAYGLAASGSLSLADNATDTFSNLGTSSFLFIYEGTQSGSAAIFVFHNNGESIAWQAGAVFSTTQDTAGKLNISAAAGTVTIQNKLGGTASLFGLWLKLG